MTLYDRLHPGSGRIPVERRTLSQYLAAVNYTRQLAELSDLASRLSVTLDVNDYDPLHLKYRSEK